MDVRGQEREEKLCLGKLILKTRERSNGVYSELVCSQHFQEKGLKGNDLVLVSSLFCPDDHSCLRQLFIALRDKSKLLSIVLQPW